eukprot:CAMPEP_0194157536 /NCGR_PEP_ID=MMETSP0152-20130528/72412_1 /TAXON_ID=1049557 /ORGANISM="Thalassiothrix antarctica, Strain L6-D1" /LENGTH=120 /DNA_ID=CAMNT_0038866007 /DNA_START=104 /DNA_END=462 /DNA_ORIENTATION=-
MSFQEPFKALNATCMAVPWLFVMGFSVAYTAMYMKSWNIPLFSHELTELEQAYYRTNDIGWSAYILVISNVILLTTWTVTAPWVWSRSALDSYDKYNRPLETYGTCQGRDSAEYGPDLSP